MALEFENITKEIIGSAFEVHRVLGFGFLEKVYQKAMQVELIQRGMQCEVEHPITVYYKNAIVGEYRADLFVEGIVVVELKVAKCYQPDDEPQLLNELKATRKKCGLLINFRREKVEFRRMVF